MTPTTKQAIALATDCTFADTTRFLALADNEVTEHERCMGAVRALMSAEEPVMMVDLHAPYKTCCHLFTIDEDGTPNMNADDGLPATAYIDLHGQSFATLSAEVVESCSVIDLPGGYAAYITDDGVHTRGHLFSAGQNIAHIRHDTGHPEAALAALLHIENWPLGFANVEQANRTATELLADC